MAEPHDASAYYGYLFKANKQPTTILNALLRAIAIYITENIGDVEKKCLTPEKMAAFYKTVGGNYDSLFVDVPPTSISWIYTSIGCEHMLLPTDDHFIPPSIPSLTIAGFVRWQSIEILLGPEEHVPFIQTSLRLFKIKHPDTYEPFPVDLPSAAFPPVPDPEIEKWHDICARQLRKWAAAEDKHGDSRSESNVKSGFTHIRSCPGSGREENYYDQMPPRDRPRSTYRSDPRYGPFKSSSNPGYMSQKYMQSEEFGTPGARGRRRSNPESMRSPDLKVEPEIHEIVVEEAPARRHKVRLDHNGRQTDRRQTRRRSSSSDATSEELLQFRRTNMGNRKTSKILSSDSSSGDDDKFPAYAYTSRNRMTSYPESHRFDPSERASPKVSSKEKDIKKSSVADDLPTATGYATFSSASRSRYKKRDQTSGEEDSRRRNFRIPVFLSENMPFGIGKKDEYWLRHHRNGNRGGRNLRWQGGDSNASAIRETREILHKVDRHKRDVRENKGGIRGGEHGWDWEVRSRHSEAKPQKNYEDVSRDDRYSDRAQKGRGLSFRERDANRRYIYHDNLDLRSPIRNVGGSHYKGG